MGLAAVAAAGEMAYGAIPIERGPGPQRARVSILAVAGAALLSAAAVLTVGPSLHTMVVRLSDASEIPQDAFTTRMSLSESEANITAADSDKGFIISMFSGAVTGSAMSLQAVEPETDAGGPEMEPEKPGPLAGCSPYGLGGTMTCGADCASPCVEEPAGPAMEPSTEGDGEEGGEEEDGEPAPAGPAMEPGTEEDGTEEPAGPAMEPGTDEDGAPAPEMDGCSSYGLAGTMTCGADCASPCLEEPPASEPFSEAPSAEPDADSAAPAGEPVGSAVDPNPVTAGPEGEPAGPSPEDPAPAPAPVNPPTASEEQPPSAADAAPSMEPPADLGCPPFGPAGALTCGPDCDGPCAEDPAGAPVEPVEEPDMEEDGTDTAPDPGEEAPDEENGVVPGCNGVPAIPGKTACDGDCAGMAFDAATGECSGCIGNATVTATTAGYCVPDDGMSPTAEPDADQADDSGETDTVNTNEVPGCGSMGPLPGKTECDAECVGLAFYPVQGVCTGCVNGTDLKINGSNVGSLTPTPVLCMAADEAPAGTTGNGTMADGSEEELLPGCGDSLPMFNKTACDADCSGLYLVDGACVGCVNGIPVTPDTVGNVSLSAALCP